MHKINPEVIDKVKSKIVDAFDNDILAYSVNASLNIMVDKGRFIDPRDLRTATMAALCTLLYTGRIIIVERNDDET